MNPQRTVDLVEDLSRQIKTGRLKPGDRLPTFAQMKAERRVAPTTLDRVYARLEQDGLIVRENGRGVFVADCKARVLQHAIGLAGFDPKTGQSSYWVHVLSAVQEVLHGADMELVHIRHGSSRGLDRVDALLLHGCIDYGFSLAASLMPRVCLMEKLEGFSAVLADDFEGARLATQHLVRLGHRKIACMNYLGAPVNQQRLAGYRSALQDAGVSPELGWIRNLAIPSYPTLRDTGYVHMKHWLAEDWRQQGYTALLCQNDAVAIGAMQALSEGGLNVPRDVSVIGFDGTEEGNFITPHLTSVEVPLEQIGKAAAELLLRQLHETEPQTVSMMLPVRLIVRDSTAPINVRMAERPDH